MLARSDLISLSALLMQVLPFAVTHPASGNPSGFSWPRNWPFNSNGAVSHGNPSGNGGCGDGWDDEVCGGHVGGGGQWNDGGGWPQTVTVTTEWLDCLKLNIELIETLTEIL